MKTDENNTWKINVSSNIHTYVCTECSNQIGMNYGFVNTVVQNAGILGAIRTIVSTKENTHI